MFNSIVQHGYHSGGYERAGIFPVSLVFDNIDSDVSFGGSVIQLSSVRYKVFKQSLYCACCAAMGMYFAKEKSACRCRAKGAPPRSQRTEWRTVGKNNWHLNLYHLNQDGREILMTQDHILPKSLGGEDSLNNLQTMCRSCNRKKGNSWTIAPTLLQSPITSMYV